MRVTAGTAGPVEATLAAAIAALGLRGTDVEVSASPTNARTGFTVTARDAATCERVADALRSVAGVENVSVAPPRAYVDVTAAQLAELVVPAVLAAPGRYGECQAPDARRPLVVMLFSNPNSNKPLHLGHLRQNAFGMALSRLFESGGWTVERVDMLGDWGIHICYALVGYLHWGEEIGTQSSGLKGDRFAGRCLVRFHEENARQREASGGEQTALETEARTMLLSLEAGDPELLRLWRRFTGWVELGFDETHARIGTTFETVVRESHARLRARKLYEDGLARGVFERRDDGSVHVDLSDRGLFDVTLFRGDGTATAYVQHTGPEDELFEKYDFDKLLFVYGPDWAKPHKVSEELYKLLELPWAARLEGLDHGLVSLPSGRMRSRSGVVLNVDLLTDAVAEVLRAQGRSDDEAEALAVALLKYAFLRVPRQTDVVFELDHFDRVVVPELATVSEALRAAETPGAGLPVSVLREVNGFPSVVARALAQREPALVVRAMRRLAEAVVEGSANDGLEPGLATAARASLHRALSLLNLDIPGGIDGFSPSRVMSGAGLVPTIATRS